MQDSGHEEGTGKTKIRIYMRERVEKALPALSVDLKCNEVMLKGHSLSI